MEATLRTQPNNQQITLDKAHFRHMASSSHQLPSVHDTEQRSDINLQDNEKDRKVVVVLLGWQDDDISVWGELLAVEDAFKEGYGFDVKRLPIWSNSPSKVVEDSLRSYYKILSPDDLLIVVYEGHGALNSNGSYSMSGKTYPPWKKPAPRRLDWISVQKVLLNEAQCDVLILVSACHAAGAIPLSDIPRTGRAEMIAECGYHETTNAPPWIKSYN